MTPEIGIHKGIPFPEYLEWDAVSNSVLVKMARKSPAHAKEFMDNPPDPTEAMRFGSALHTKVLEPETFEDRYIVAPKVARRTKQGKEDWANFEAEAEHRDIILEDVAEQLNRIAGEITKHSAIKFIDGGVPEVCILWEDKKTGVKCKARLDYIHPPQAIQVDVKTTKDASPDGFARSIWNYSYHQQFAFYSEGWQALTGDELASVILACEKEPPYAIAVYELHEEIMFAGKNAWQNALAKYAKCLETDEWPGYYEGPQILNLPRWALERAGVGPHNLRI